MWYIYSPSPSASGLTMIKLHLGAIMLNVIVQTKSTKLSKKMDTSLAVRFNTGKKQNRVLGMWRE